MNTKIRIRINIFGMFGAFSAYMWLHNIWFAVLIFFALDAVLSVEKAVDSVAEKVGLTKV